MVIKLPAKVIADEFTNIYSTFISDTTYKDKHYVLDKVVAVNIHNEDKSTIDVNMVCDDDTTKVFRFDFIQHAVIKACTKGCKMFTK